MKRLLRWPQLWAFLALFAFTPAMVEAQCINTTQYPSAINTIDQTTTTPITISTCNFTQEYSVLNVNFPAMYTFGINAVPGYVTVTDASNNVISHGPSPHTATIAGTGQYRVHWNDNAACGNTVSCYTTTAVFFGFLGNCIPPLGITAAGITSNSANISFTASTSAPANGYEYVVTPTFGTPAGSGTPTTATTFPATGLNPNTQYYVYVRAMCGPDTSVWNSTSFFTTCTAVVAPWVENFDGATWSPTTTFDQCWSANPSTGYRWQVEDGPTTSTNTGPTSDHTTGSGQYIYTEASSSGTEATMTTPLIDLSGITNPALYFWKHLYGDDIDSFFVEVDGGTGWQVVHSSFGQIQTANADAWLDEEISLNAWAGGSVQIRFRGVYGGSFDGDISIDDVSVDVGPNCFRPSSISLVSIGVTDVTVNWVPADPTSTWEVAYGAPGFDPDLAVGAPNGPIALVPASSYPLQVTGLTANTDYEFYVREACTTPAGTWSSWRGVVSTRTNCTVFSAPFFENFDGSTWVWGTSTGDIDPCWNRNAAPTSTFSWMVDDDNTSTVNGPSQDHTTGSGQFMTTESYGSVGQTAELTSPLVDLTGLTNPAVGFYFHMYGDDMDTLRIQVNDGSGWVTLGTLGGQYQTAETDPWLYHEESLAAYAGQTVQVRFSTTRPSNCCNFDIAIDDVLIGDGSPCAIPGFPTVSTVSGTELDVVWTDVANVAWNVVWGLPGFDPDLAVGAPNGPVGTQLVFVTSHQITGLMGDTDYQVYVNAFCPTGGVSFWSGPATGTTAVLPPYLQDFDGAYLPRGWSEADGILASPTNFTATSSLWTTDNYENVSGASQCAKMNIWSTGRHEWLISPAIDLQGGGNWEMTFDGAATEFSNTATAIWGVDDSLIVVVSTDGGLTFDRSNTILAFHAGNPLAAPGQNYAASLTAYTGMIKIGFYATGTVSNEDIDVFVENFEINNPPLCPNIMNLACTGSATATSLTVGWTEGTAGATSWEIEAVPAGQPMGSGTVQTATTNPYTFTGLNPSTQYDFYVREQCPNGVDFSNWVGGASCNTLCVPVPAPWSDSFEAGISNCWIQSTTDNLDFQQHSGSTSSSNTGPTSANDGTYYIYPETSGSAAGWKANIRTPEVDITTVTNPALVMDYHMFGAGMGWFRVMVDSANSGNIDTLFALYGNQGNQWNTLVLSLAGYEDPTTGALSVILELEVDDANGFAFENDLAFDHVRIEQGPACFGPAFMTATATSSSSADVSFSPVDPTATAWEIEYGPQGYVAGTGTVVSVSSPTASITGLASGTCYDFRVREACSSSPGSFSLWSAPAGACTFIAPPYFEAFSPTYDAAGWTEGDGLIGEPTIFTGTSSSWVDDGFGNVGFDGSAKMNIYSTFPQEWTFTPVIELNNFGQWQLEFDWTCREFANTLAPLWGWDDTVYVVISTDAGLTWNRSDALLMLDSATVVANGTDTVHEVIDISMYAGNNIQIGFYAESTVSNEDTDFFIDNVRISDPTLNPLTCDDFEAYNVGPMAGQSTDWLPWGGSFGTEDGEVSSTQAHGGSQSLHIHDGGTNGASDIVRGLGDFGAGTHEVSFWFNVPSGSGGYWNLMHYYNANGSGNTWALETFIDGSTGMATMLRGSLNNDTLNTFTITPGTWHEAQFVVNLDADSAEFILDGTSVGAWIWSGGGAGVYGNLGAVNFYSADVNGLPAEMYVDDFCTGALNAPCVVTTQPTTSDVTVCEGTPATFTATVGSSTAFPVWTNANGDVIGSGTPFNTDTLYADETFSVQDAELVGPQFHVGPTPDIATTGFGNFTNGMFVTVMNDLRLDSITLRSDGPMVVGVNLWSDDPNNGGVLLQTSDALTLPASGDHQVHVDMVIPQGSYFLNMRYDDAANGALFRATAGATFPYVIPDLVSLDSINFANQLRYYYLFDWVVNQVCLNGVPVDADAMIDAAPTAAFSANQSGGGMETVDLDAGGSSSDVVTYSWDFGDGNTGSGATVQHTYAAAGQYTITLTVTDDCGGTDVTTQVVDVTIGLTEIDLTSVSLFPNPTRDNFNLTFEVTEVQDVDIYVLNAMGQVMFSEKLENFSGSYSETISLAGEAKGVYMVQIATKDGMINRRVSLQ